VRSDLVLQIEPFRRFAVAEVRAGRVPLWNPLSYAGAPFLAANQPAVFSPFRLLDYLWPDPRVIAWGQLAQALTAGAGAYLFFRRALGLRFPAAAVGAWAWPLCGFLVLWSGYPSAATASWLPWVLLAVDRALALPGPRSGPLLALAVAATLVSGHAGVGAQVLMGAALYAGARGVAGRRRPQARRALATLVLGFALGAALSAVQSLPTLDYLRSSARVAARAAGGAETEAAGGAALVQTVLPYFHGSTQTGSLYLAPGNRAESAAAGYGGLILALVAAPLGFLERRRRGHQAFWAALALLGLAQVLGAGRALESLPATPLALLRNNRLVLWTAWAVTAAGATGLDALGAGWRGLSGRAAVLLAVAPAALGALSAYRAVVPAPALVAELSRAQEWLDSGRPLGPPYLDGQNLVAIRRWFSRRHLAGAAACLAAVAVVALARAPRQGPGLVWAAGALLIAEMTANARGVQAQSDPALYYPPVPALAALSAAGGRASGVLCLPSALNEVHGLRDVRGYDAVDPRPMVELLALFRDPRSPAPDYAAVQWFAPLDSPLADMLALRHLIHRGAPPEGVRPAVASPDYWVVERPTALGRAFVPRRAVAVEPGDVLDLLARPDFDPRAVAYAPALAPAPPGPVSGTARITAESPGRIELEATTDGPGLVVVSEQWDAGWRARLNGAPAPVLRVNHALQGVVVGGGRSVIALRYRPRSFLAGCGIAAAAAGSLMLWSLAFRRAKEEIAP
jgi:hypothetical protein